MIIKSADSKDASIARLESLLAIADSKKQNLIMDELRMLRAGIKGEQESAYHIDFFFEKSKSTAVLHDLRLEIGNRVAQIDHLLIHRTHRFYIFETKSFAHGLKINAAGEFLRWNDWKKQYDGMPSPIEQNKRHALVLREVLEQLGYKNPAIEPFVLISPNARIDRPQAGSYGEVLKADQCFTAIQTNLDSATGSVGGFFNALSKVAFGEAPHIVAEKLLHLHRPIAIDYEAKFGLRAAAALAPSLPAPPPRPTPVVIEQAAQRASAVQAQPDKSVPPSLHVCKACGSDALSIQYGKYGYYFKCSACGGNTAFKVGCGVEGHHEKIRKDKLAFYRECESCRSSSVFFVNKS